MDRVLVVRLGSARSARGEAVLLDGGQKKHKFQSAHELLSPHAGAKDLAVLVGGHSTEHPAYRELLSEWSGAPGLVQHAADLSYLFDLAPPDSLDGLCHLARQVRAELQRLPDDLLAQLSYLVEEAGALERAGWLVAELHYRHDALSLPAAGQVDLGSYFPARRHTGAVSSQDVPEDLLERVFEAREAMERAFERYEERAEQRQMVLAVEEALREGTPLVIEAGTGVGKSLAYLLPLAVHAAQRGKLCLVSTNTLNLQQQLVDLDIPRLTAILDVLDLRVTLLKGREHYLCVKRLEDTWLSNSAGARQRRQHFLAHGPAAVLLALKLLLSQCGDERGDLDLVPTPGELPLADRERLLRGVDCGFATCLGDRCQYKGNCHFFAQRTQAMLSHLVITNHALVFSLHDPSGTEADNVVSRADVIVFDEAHNLESAITNQLTLEVSHTVPVDLGNALRQLIETEGCRRRLELGPDQVADEWREALIQAQQGVLELTEKVRLGIEVRDQINRLLSQAADYGHVPPDAAAQLTPPTASPNQLKVLGLLAQLGRRLLTVVNWFSGVANALNLLLVQEESPLYLDDDMFQMELQALLVTLKDCQVALNRWNPADPQAITWFNCELQPDDPRWEYKHAPLDVGPVFQQLFNAKECVILCSATLTVAGGFDYLQASLGFAPESIGRTTWVQLESPFDYARQALLLVATDLAGPTGPSRDTYLDQLEEVVAGVAEVFPRGVLVLFNSYRDLNHIAQRLGTRLPFERLLVQGKSGPRAEIAERFRSEGDKLLLATRSFWEGFDVAGEALSCVVLAKLPFANFKDPIHAGRQRAIDADGGDSFNKYSLPLAAMQLKQGFGRLIRTTSDFGCVFLLDSRVASAKYGKVFLETLPGPAVTRGTYRVCLDAAREFMADRERAAAKLKEDGSAA